MCVVRTGHPDSGYADGADAQGGRGSARGVRRWQHSRPEPVSVLIYFWPFCSAAAPTMAASLLNSAAFQVRPRPPAQGPGVAALSPRPLVRRRAAPAEPRQRQQEGSPSTVHEITQHVRSISVLNRVSHDHSAPSASVSFACASSSFSVSSSHFLRSCSFSACWHITGCQVSQGHPGQ